MDLVTTSEVAVSVTVDNTDALSKLIPRLKEIGDRETQKDQCIICIVGHFITESKGYAKRIFHALEEIPINMISFGGSKHNISILVDQKHKKRTLERLHQEFFYIERKVKYQKPIL